MRQLFLTHRPAAYPVDPVGPKWSQTDPVWLKAGENTPEEPELDFPPPVDDHPPANIFDLPSMDRMAAYFRKQRPVT